MVAGHEHSILPAKDPHGIGLIDDDLVCPSTGNLHLNHALGAIVVARVLDR